MAGKRVLSVGQCGADDGAIRWAMEKHFAAEVIPAATAAEAEAKLRQEPYDLVLVNRILDADGSSGLDLIERLKAAEGSRTVPVMLVSNYEDWQRQAVAKGALPGFGKSGLGQPQMLGRLRPILGENQ
jgi:DNA-binding NtrC family response regulator